MQYCGTNVLKHTDMEGANVTGADGIFASSVYDADNDCIYIKVINVSEQPREIKINFEGLRKKDILTGVEAVSFHSEDPDAENTLDEPYKIVPQTVSLDFEGRALEVAVAPKTFMVYVIKK
jgi:alpha-L-arabinofuranosidase